MELRKPGQMWNGFNQLQSRAEESVKLILG